MERPQETTSDFSELESWDPEGDRVAVGYRPSGELHVGNLLSIAYAATVASQLGLTLDLMNCDTDWSAHIHSQTKPGESNVMKLFFNRECPCGEHDNLAEHRAEEIEPFLEGLEEELDIEIERGFLSDLHGDEDYLEALRDILNKMDSFNEIFEGGFRRRYESPVVNVCDCGYSHAKGAPYSEETDELVSSCRNPDCDEAFAASPLRDEIGVYYLVDPVRDVSRNVAVHVFGGDYRSAEKEQTTSKVWKVREITRLATGENPYYFLAPMIADKEGKPLSKSKGTGTKVSEIGDLRDKAGEIVEKIDSWMDEEKKYVSEEELV
ncbi:MAG: hypothetical protein ABEJ99_05410 [Candidatus Nanohaloarchaea archaeon]